MDNYYIFIYDVPSSTRTLYFKILHRLQGKCIRLSGSVYITSDRFIKDIREIVNDAETDTGLTAKVDFIKLSEDEQSLNYNRALTSLRESFKELKDNYYVKSQDRSKKKKYFDDVKRKTATISELIKEFSLPDIFKNDVESFYNKVDADSVSRGF